MKCLIIGRYIAMRLLSRWKVSFVIKLNISILIEPRSNYSYVNLDLVDKCGINKEVHESLG